jgi:UDP:flavonoid glycosyltransferase YjiC (YdhE family)
MVPSAWALYAAGHEVLVAAPEDFLPKIMRAGLPAAASSGPLDMLEIMTSGSGGSLRPTDVPFGNQVSAAARGFAMVAERTVDGMSALLRDWRADLVIGESTAFGVPLAADRHGVPWVEHRHGPAMPAELRKLVAEELSRELPDPMLIVDNCPPSFQHDDASAGQVIRYVPYNGPGVVTDWMLAKGDRKRVCVTLGTGLPHDPGSWSLLELMVATLDELGVEMILAVPNPDEVQRPPWAAGALPASVRAAGRFPLSAMVPTCDLVINHGGAGSTMTTLVNGVPQLVVPHYGDQFLNAQLVSQRAVGLAIPVSDISPEAVKTAASTLLDAPEYRQAAEKIAQENATLPSPADLVEVLRTRMDR